MSIFTKSDEFCAALQSDVPVDSGIIGAPWPTVVPGAMRASCAECKAYVSLSPATGLKMHTQFPAIPVLCYPCGVKRGWLDADDVSKSPS